MSELSSSLQKQKKIHVRSEPESRVEALFMDSMDLQKDTKMLVVSLEAKANGQPSQYC